MRKPELNLLPKREEQTAEQLDGVTWEANRERREEMGLGDRRWENPKIRVERDCVVH